MRRREVLAGALAVLSSFVFTAKAESKIKEGVASYYGSKFHGRRTASGRIYDMNEMTAAHRTLKFGTKVKVTNLKNRRSVVVTITDRGPFIKGRIIDLSRAAASKIGMLKSGVAKVKIEVI